VTLQGPEPNRFEMRQAVDRLTRTVDHLLDATRIESGLLQPVPEWCDPGELVRETVARSGSSTEGIRMQIAPELPMIHVDVRLLEQALLTLISNAVQHGASDRPIQVIAGKDDCEIVISVIDHGRGLAPGEERKVFEKFYRGMGTAPGGLGLGLSVARQLVEANHGAIIAQNDADGGARFTVRLPAREMRLPHEASA